MEGNPVVPVPNNGLVGKLSDLLAKYPIILQLLRFAAIGVLNTGLDFVVLNFVTKTLGITGGLKLSELNVIGFALAVIQSYIWNRYWAFGTEQVSVLKNFIRLVLVGALGFLALVFVFLGAGHSAPGIYFFILFVIYILVEVILWHYFGFSKNIVTAMKSSFFSFLVVSIIGLIINSIILYAIVRYIPLTSNADLNKNLAKVIASIISLCWNFVGYKLFVFKKA